MSKETILSSKGEFIETTRPRFIRNLGCFYMILAPIIGILIGVAAMYYFYLAPLQKHNTALVDKVIALQDETTAGYDQLEEQYYRAIYDMCYVATAQSEDCMGKVDVIRTKFQPFLSESPGWSWPFIHSLPLEGG
jgi:hypothetical protein